MLKFYNYLLFLICIIVASCNNNEMNTENNISSDSASVTANRFFEKVYDDYLERHPMQQSVLGIRDRYADWDDISDSADLAEVQIVKKNVEELKKLVDYGRLDTVTKVSYKLFLYEAEQKIAGEKFLYHNYPINQLFG